MTIETRGTLWDLYIRLQAMIDRDGVDPETKVGYDDPTWGWCEIERVENDGYRITLSLS